MKKHNSVNVSCYSWPLLAPQHSEGKETKTEGKRRNTKRIIDFIIVFLPFLSPIILFKWPESNHMIGCSGIWKLHFCLCCVNIWQWHSLGIACFCLKCFLGCLPEPNGVEVFHCVFSLLWLFCSTEVSRFIYWCIILVPYQDMLWNYLWFYAQSSVLQGKAQGTISDTGELNPGPQHVREVCHPLMSLSGSYIYFYKTPQCLGLLGAIHYVIWPGIWGLPV